jgi:hypothetical protein
VASGQKKFRSASMTASLSSEHFFIASYT